MITRQGLASDLTHLGVTAGDTLFVHSSFRSLGMVEGGAQTVIDALEEVVGTQGLILMPSFNLVPMAQRLATWDVRTTPSTVGWLTEFFRQMRGTLRSNHYSHSVAARGSRASEFLADADCTRGMVSPWDRPGFGRTYGLGSPIYKSYQDNGKLLLLGVDYKVVTHIHMVEVMRWNHLLEHDPATHYRFAMRQQLGEHWERTCRAVRRCLVGCADSRLFPIRNFVDSLICEIEQDPDRWMNQASKS